MRVDGDHGTGKLRRYIMVVMVRSDCYFWSGSCMRHLIKYTIACKIKPYVTDLKTTQITKLCRTKKRYNIDKNILLLPIHFFIPGII